MRVAIVDDDQAIATALSSLLRSEGFTVSLFDSAESFLASREIDTVDCLLTDMQMPGMSGIELVRHLAQDKQDLPVLVMTAYPTPQARRRAAAAGACAFLSKPFAAEVLLKELRKALQ